MWDLGFNLPSSPVSSGDVERDYISPISQQIGPLVYLLLNSNDKRNMRSVYVS